MDIGWMANHSVLLRDHSEFSKIPEIADLIRSNGEPGVMNLVNVQKYGRYGEEKIDYAEGTNPLNA